MNFIEKIQLFFHVLRWRFTWNRRKLDFLPKGKLSAKFITAREAAKRIPDGASVFSCGMAGNARCSVFYWAIRENFLKTGHPRDLTWMNVGAQGGRGKVPGTVEEIGLPGLMRRYIAGHLETAKAQLRLGESGQLELYTMPQGVLTFLVEAQSQGQFEVLSPVGVGTFLDPRVGPGSRVTPGAASRFIEPEGDQLRYTLPKIEYVLFNVPHADAEGNLYFHDASCLSESVPALRAALANKGVVMATVADIIPKDASRISIPASEVDLIVVHPLNEQTATIRQLRYWPLFTPGANADVDWAKAKLNFINRMLKITPVRNAVDNAVERVAAWLFSKVIPKGSMVNIGVGHPEEVARNLVEQGLGKDLVFTTEAGAYGGLPIPGIFFGSAINPEKLISSTEMFHIYQEKLGVCVLGFLQVDKEGNVNAAKRGPRVTDYVGPGGFPDISSAARTVIFVGSWMADAAFQLAGGKLSITKPGKPKFVDHVDEITFSAVEALRRGKQVYYVTHVGIFQLTPDGLKLLYAMPGIDLQRDILDATGLPIALPEGDIPWIPKSAVDGIGYRLAWAD